VKTGSIVIFDFDAFLRSHGIEMGELLRTPIRILCLLQIVVPFHLLQQMAAPDRRGRRGSEEGRRKTQPSRQRRHRRGVRNFIPNGTNWRARQDSNL
jgi:hypothetical protein